MTAMAGLAGCISFPNRPYPEYVNCTIQKAYGPNEAELVEKNPLIRKIWGDKFCAIRFKTDDGRVYTSQVIRYKYEDLRDPLNPGTRFRIERGHLRQIEEERKIADYFVEVLKE